VTVLGSGGRQSPNSRTCLSKRIGCRRTGPGKHARRSPWDGAGSPAGVPYISSSLDPKGAFGGGYVGYNYQFSGGFVVGAEADINASAAKSDHNAFPAGPFGPGFSGEGDLKWFGSARLRVGYAFDRFLPFVTGGVAFGI
jgi:outer membrane immunogenic protein